MIALLGALPLCAALLSGLGTRWGWWDFRTGLALLRWSAYSGLAAALLCAALGLRTRRRAALLGLVLALPAFLIPWSWKRLARAIPPIHDITTDTQDPPVFMAIAAAGYGGPEVAAQQKAAYPDLSAMRLALPPADAFRAARQAADSMGWVIVAEVPAEGRIEATATTRWFGFKDDVAIRVLPDGPGSRVDVRSVSRVGKSDLGANARRIRAFLAKLSAA